MKENKNGLRLDIIYNSLTFLLIKDLCGSVLWLARLGPSTLKSSCNPVTSKQLQLHYIAQNFKALADVLFITCAKARLEREYLFIYIVVNPLLTLLPFSSH